MGFWGAGLYANDLTSDVRDTYIGLLQEQVSNDEAQRRTAEEYQECFGTDEEPLFWLALAETQWKTGRLTPEIKEKAMRWIDAGGGLDLWAESKSGGAGWKKTLKALKQKLESPMPPEKRIRKPKEINMDLWELGDIYAYRFLGNTPESAGFDEKYIAIQKIGTGKYPLQQSVMRIQTFDRVYNELPSLEDVSASRILPINFPTSFQYQHTRDFGYALYLSTLIGVWTRKSEYPADRLTYLGNCPLREYKNLERYSDMRWESFEPWVARLYSLWHEDAYEMDEDGVYQYTGKYRYLDPL